MESAIIGLFGVVIGGVIVLAKEWWFEYRKNNKDKEYLSIIISSKLDKFIHRCYDVVSDNGMFQGGYDSDRCSSPQVALPKFEPELENVNWKSLPVDLMYKILDFPNEVERANHKINGVVEYGSYSPDYKEAFEERQYQYALLCVKAFEIASTLRKEANITERIYAWDIIGRMHDEILEIEKLRKDKVKHEK